MSANHLQCKFFVYAGSESNSQFCCCVRGAGGWSRGVETRPGDREGRGKEGGEGRRRGRKESIGYGV